MLVCYVVCQSTLRINFSINQKLMLIFVLLILLMTSHILRITLFEFVTHTLFMWLENKHLLLNKMRTNLLRV